MKKTLLSLFVAVMATFTAHAQDNLLKNASFEDWTEGYPTYWKSASTASSKNVLSESTDPKTGAKAVAIKGSTSNVRLAYNEITLKKGTYTFSVNAKSSLASSNSTLGYTAVGADNKVIGSYVYPKAEDGKTTVYTAVTQSWTPVTFQFTLAEDTHLALVVMAAKNDAAYTLTVDDASLTTTDGGIVEGTTPAPTPDPAPQPEAGVIYQKALTDNAEGWTLGTSPAEDGSAIEVWRQDTRYGLVGKAFIGGAKLAAEAWAISPEIQLTTDNVLTFDHAQRFAGNAAEEFTLWIRQAGAAQNDWTKLNITHSDGTNWNFVPAGNISLSAFNGKKVQFGFKYMSTTEAAGTWEFKNFKVAGAPNSINAIATEKGENVIFDLSGRRVKKAENGIFIINGVKQVVK